MIDEISRRTIKMKLELLVIDPFEGKLDPQLELGHTIGHAVEIVKSGKLLHGEAVSIGMVAEARISCALGFMNNGLCTKIADILTKIGLPINIPADITVDQIVETLKYDNKRKTVKNDFFLLEDFTRFHKQNGKIGTKVPEATLRQILESCY
jgi:3-dehydroquinate synthase